METVQNEGKRQVTRNLEFYNLDHLSWLPHQLLPGHAVSDMGNEDMPWKITKKKEVIDDESVFYRNPVYSVRSYSREMRNVND